MAEEHEGTTGAQFGEAPPLSETNERDDAIADEDFEGEEADDEAEGSFEID